MKKIGKTTFIAAVAATTILAFAVGCGSESPAAAPTEVAASPTPDAAPTATAQAEPETPAADASPEPTAPPSPVPSGDDAQAALLPPAIQILSPAYQEAYRLLPDGEWAQRYFAVAYFEDFDYQEWSVMSETPPDILDISHELGRGTEWKLTRILRDDDEQEWFVRRIGELDADAARSFEATQAEEDRIDILRTLYEEGRKDREIQDIIVEWEMRLEGLQGEELARQLEFHRDKIQGLYDRSVLSPKEWTVRVHEQKVCELLSYFVIGGSPSDVQSGADCYIEKAVSLSKQALERRGGQPIIDEDEFREMARGFVEWRNADPPQDPTPTLDS